MRISVEKYVFEIPTMDGVHYRRRQLI